MVVAAISGLADVDALTLSVANMGAGHGGGDAAILLTLGVNSAAKAVYAGIAGGMRLGITLFLLNMAAMAVAVASYLLVPSPHF